eukprot:GHVT01043228.1.p2 GENE.GHVT01043228.1~~GHVT01043228.1.p2  ORF type:complete len:143 (+),score=24.36 GHVT01043228.1:691-1119(+)
MVGNEASTESKQKDIAATVFSVASREAELEQRKEVQQEHQAQVSSLAFSKAEDPSSLAADASNHRRLLALAHAKIQELVLSIKQSSNQLQAKQLLLDRSDSLLEEAKDELKKPHALVSFTYDAKTSAFDCWIFILSIFPPAE